MSKVWFIIGIRAGTARAAALRAGDRVVATGRKLDKVRDAYRAVAGDDLLLERLDVTSEAEAKRTVDAAVAPLRGDRPARSTCRSFLVGIATLIL
jgi:NAD(P)-dependent dehydrogenase (short-subunit alcohol dehydrogenase family)